LRRKQERINWNDWTAKYVDHFELTGNESIKRFAALIREQHTKELLGARVEPVTSTVKCNVGYECDCSEDATHCCSPTVDLYTAEQFAAHVAQKDVEIERERESRKAAQIENESLKAELARRDDMKAKVAQLEANAAGHVVWSEAIGERALALHVERDTLRQQLEAARKDDLRGIDADPVSEWVHLIKHGNVSKDECLIAVKDIPKWLAQERRYRSNEASRLPGHRAYKRRLKCNVINFYP